jgi:hypothetical protein
MSCEVEQLINDRRFKELSDVLEDTNGPLHVEVRRSTVEKVLHRSRPRFVYQFERCRAG